MQRHLLLLMMVMSFFVAKSQEVEIIIDRRDANQYRTIILDSVQWMTENLNYKIKGGSDLIPDCDSCGRLYYYAQAINACPEGFHLPEVSDWHRLFKSLNGKKVIDDGVYFYNINDTIRNPDFLNMKYCGYIHTDKRKDDLEITYDFCGTYGAFWHLNTVKGIYDGIHFENYNADWIGTVSGREDNGFSVRCIRHLKQKR